MDDNYSIIAQNNIRQLYLKIPDNFDALLPAVRDKDAFIFHAFGQECRISPEGIFLDAVPQHQVMGVLISLYALHVNPEPCRVLPLRAYQEFPNTMPYAAAFKTHTESILIPYVERIKANIEKIKSCLKGENPPPGISGDFSFLVYPLPKIALCYIFYEGDDDFPPSVTCLYSSNAASFIPVDGLADIGEYTSRKICSFF